MHRIESWLKWEKAKQTFSDLISINFNSNAFTYIGDQIEDLMAAQKGIGVTAEYVVSSGDNTLITVFDSKGADWLNIQVIPNTGWTSAQLFIEWSIDNTPTSLWSNAIPNANFVSLGSSPEGIVMELRGFSFTRLRFVPTPLTATALCKVRYT